MALIDCAECMETFINDQHWIVTISCKCLPKPYLEPEIKGKFQKY